MSSNFGKSLEASFRRIRPFLAPSYRRAFGQMLKRGMKEHREGEPIVVCDFANPAIDSVGGRYYASMVLDLIEAGYFPVFTAHRPTLSSFVISRKKSLLLHHRMGVIRSLDELKQPYFLITDSCGPVPELAEKVVRVTYDHRLKQSESEIELPFFVHPQIGTKVALPHPYQVATPRSARIFFGGNTMEHRYDKDVLGDFYGLLTRREMLATASSAAGDTVYRPTDAETWLAADDFHPFVLFETQNVKIPQKRWIDALAKADFFLACPGVGMPLCHNLIEAIAGGAIPILQYAAYLPKPLQHGKNCISFSDVKSLESAIRSVLEMPGEQIIEMRQNVKDYYDEFMAPGQFSRRLFADGFPNRTLLINAYRVPR
ncbi:hypothetical protein JIN85_08750 [Luteolibacter pohnpeiensis]|uniref:Uncharacterized protein n=1 Tax=Luteolibacter pohnpeiensis TaxID=454153 RepID=A0A934VUG1_9BACT|nr:hypothetical protein [Luteolibacter pohnpeiensis]MBK1882502.1 hypothetical protein [Luteolibacter pohnpeiensis]